MVAVAHTINPSSQEAEAGKLCEFETSLVYKSLQSHRETLPRKTKQNKKRPMTSLCLKSILFKYVNQSQYFLQIISTYLVLALVAQPLLGKKEKDIQNGIRELRI